jgi:hypothetical protein
MPGIPPPGQWARYAPLALVALLVLAGCAQTEAPAALAAPARPADPLAAFAAEAIPGATGRVVLADGRSVAARVTRSYVAASGRDCREVLVMDGPAGRSALYCRDEALGWQAARPLVRGGATEALRAGGAGAARAGQR